MRVQCAEMQKVLGSVHRMNLGGNVVVMDGEKSYAHNKASGQRTRIKYDDAQYVMYMWVPSMESEVEEESEEVLKGNRFAILATESEELSAGRCETRKSA